MEEEKKSGFKINDRRLFDEKGNEIQKTAEPESQIIKETVKAEDNNFRVSDTDDGQHSEINFASFIASLATQALMQMGEMPAPEGMELPKDIQAAKQTIDIISMLKQKTSGNLDAQENYFLEEMLHSLRLSFLKHQ